MAKKFKELRDKMLEDRENRLIGLIERCPYCLMSKGLTLLKQSFFVQKNKVVMILRCSNCLKKSVWTLERCEEDK